jgi:glycine C-acetyltransferase
MGRTGRGTPEHCGVAGRIDVLTTTFGKALGGASGGCIAGRKETIDLLRQRSRPYLFSNTLPPVVAGATLRALALLSSTTELRDRLESNTKLFRERMTAAGFEIRPGVHPIVPIMFSRFAPEDALLAQRFARALLDEGVYVKGFFFPVVPRGLSRIRVQISAAHSREQIERAVAAFTKVGKGLAVV